MNRTVLAFLTLVISTSASAQAQVFDPAVIAALKAQMGKLRAIHRVVDQFVKPGEGWRLNGEFKVSRVLGRIVKNQAVSVYIRLPGKTAWTFRGQSRTNTQGIATWLEPSHGLLAGQTAEFKMILERDGTGSEGIVRVVAPGSRAIVFDIDATLTTADSEFTRQMLNPKYDPKFYIGSQAVVQYYVKRGAEVTYITGRNDRYRRETLAWLSKHGFPRAVTTLAPTFSDILPTAVGVQEYKYLALRDLMERVGLTFPRAYGNSSTDICAYAMAGIPTDWTFIIGKHSGDACKGYGSTQSVGPDYSGHALALMMDPKLQF
ncbi:MAG: hypothetical protein JNL01_13680 [Bdellovibrionales bacterium]|nr:hypothetical protein [Bdellovibrionales bacterium]